MASIAIVSYGTRSMKESHIDSLQAAIDNTTVDCRPIVVTLGTRPDDIWQLRSIAEEHGGVFASYPYGRGRGMGYLVEQGLSWIHGDKYILLVPAIIHIEDKEWFSKMVMGLKPQRAFATVAKPEKWNTRPPFPLDRGQGAELDRTISFFERGVLDSNGPSKIGVDSCFVTGSYGQVWSVPSVRLRLADVAHASEKDEEATG